MRRRLSSPEAVGPCTCGGTVNEYALVFVAMASSASWPPSPLALRVRSAQLSGLKREKLSV